MFTVKMYTNRFDYNYGKPIYLAGDHNREVREENKNKFDYVFRLFVGMSAKKRYLFMNKKTIDCIVMI